MKGVCKTCAHGGAAETIVRALYQNMGLEVDKLVQNLVSQSRSISSFWENRKFHFWEEYFVVVLPVHREQNQMMLSKTSVRLTKWINQLEIIFESHVPWALDIWCLCLWFWRNVIPGEEEDSPDPHFPVGKSETYCQYKKTASRALVV